MNLDNLDTIFGAIKEIGIINVLLVLFVLYQFKMTSWLKKQNEYLLRKLIEKEQSNGNNQDHI